MLIAAIKVNRRIMSSVLMVSILICVPLRRVRHHRVRRRHRHLAGALSGRTALPAALAEL